jgi:hypothetical protein
MQLLLRFGLPVPVEMSGAIVSDTTQVEKTTTVEKILPCQSARLTGGMKKYHTGSWERK